MANLDCGGLRALNVAFRRGKNEARSQPDEQRRGTGMPEVPQEPPKGAEFRLEALRRG